MSEIITSEDLSQAIIEVRAERDASRKAIRLQIKSAYESFLPSGLIKTALNFTSFSDVLNSTFIRTSMALLVGYISKTFFIGASRNWMRKSLGYYVSVSLTNVVLRNPVILNAIGSWLKSFGSKKSSTQA